MAKKTLLIVEDEENIANAQKLILQDEFDIHIANDGETGLKKAKELKPDLILLDLMLPKMNGIDVCKSIRIDPEIGDSKIIMVTAKNQPQDEMQGMETGADDYIMKPFEADELKHVVSQVLK
jgi:DNA-binding response OmpR family regulator